MKVLVLGSTGMLGHKLLQVLSGRFRVAGTVRKDRLVYADHPILGGFELFGGVDADDFASVEQAIGSFEPDVVINCIGMIKQQHGAKKPVVAIAINSLFPHRAAGIAYAARARFIHISTDCVFSGRKGQPYTEDDPSDAEDLYGKTKYLGEVTGEGALTIRTSIIGRELGSKFGLVEWFLSNRGGTVRGYRGALYTGLTTPALARILTDILEYHPRLCGLWHVSSENISKYELLASINDKMNLSIDIIEDTEFQCDRRLDSSRFRTATGITVPSWSEMIAEMAADETPYGIL